MTFQPDNWTNSCITCTGSPMLSKTIPTTRRTTGTDLTGHWTRQIHIAFDGEQTDSSLELNNVERLNFYAPGQGIANVTRYVYQSWAPSLFNNKLRKKCMCSQKFVPAGIDVYTRSRHLASKKHEVVYYKTPAAKPLISAKVRFCNAHTADSPHVHSPDQGKSTNVGQNQKRSCRTILPYTPSGQTRSLELLTVLASSTTRSSKAIFDGISHLRGLLSQISLQMVRPLISLAVQGLTRQLQDTLLLISRYPPYSSTRSLKPSFCGS